MRGGGSVTTVRRAKPGGCGVPCRCPNAGDKPSMTSTAALGPVISSTTMNGSSVLPLPETATMVNPPPASLKVIPPVVMGRVTPGLPRDGALAAASEGKSMNEWLSKWLSETIEEREPTRS